MVTFSILSPCLIALTTFCVSSITRPKTECLPSSQGVATCVMKNCEPLVFGPELAIDSTPGPVVLQVLVELVVERVARAAGAGPLAGSRSGS